MATHGCFECNTYHIKALRLGWMKKEINIRKKETSKNKLKKKQLLKRERKKDDA